MLTILIAPLVLAACLGPDPAATSPSEPGGGPVQQPEGGTPPGMVPGRPVGGGRMEPHGFQVEPGEGVMISGTLQYQGTAEGEYRIDFLAGEESGGMPGAAATLSLDAPGAWSVEAPMGYGKLQICAFLDTNGDGPSPGEPKVMLETPIDVGDEPVTGIALVVQDNWDDVHMDQLPKGKPAEMKEGNPEGSPVDLGVAPVAGAAPAVGAAPAAGAVSAEGAATE